jgi:excisionase family DNA binding protein
MKIESNSKHSVIAERYVDIKAVSKYTSLPVKTLYEWSGTGRIPSIKIGRKVLFDLQDIDKMMESMKRTCNKEEKIVNKILGGVHGN